MYGRVQDFAAICGNSAKGADALRRADLLNYQLNEIAAATVNPGEENDLRNERGRLANAETWLRCRSRR